MTVQRSQVTSAVFRTQIPATAARQARPICKARAGRSTLPQACGTTVNTEATAEMLKTAIATSNGTIRAATGKKISAAPKPAKP